MDRQWEELVNMHTMRSLGDWGRQWEELSANEQAGRGACAVMQQWELEYLPLFSPFIYTDFSDRKAHV